MNSLGRRLTAVKRELTDLKTAHRKGLGLLKVYKKDMTISAPSGSDLAYWLEITCTFSVSNYPFVRFYPLGVEPSSSPEFNYTNSGSKCQYRAVYFKNDWQGKVTIYSTSPIDSATYTWSQL